MDFNTYLKENARRVEKELDKILSEFLKETKKISPKLLPLVKEFVKSCEGGKRIRGVLVKMGYEIAERGKHLRGEKMRLHLGGEILRIGAALEIMHTAILVHDDIIDKSPFRRNKPSLYITVGQSQAITLADLGFFLATKILAETSADKAVIMFSQTMINTAFGQMLDVTKADPLIIAHLKTAQYTISGPLILGTILAGKDPTSPLRRQSGYGASETRLRRIKEFGDNLGIAFQIKDDILDGERSALDQALVVKYVSLAKKAIPRITPDLKMRKLLESMTEYLIERKS